MAEFPKHLRCIADGCPEGRVARGLCNVHYQARYRELHADRKRESDRRWRQRVDYNAQRRKPKQVRSCADPKCGAEFATSIPHQRFCSGRCKKRMENRRLRGRGGADR